MHSIAFTSSPALIREAFRQHQTWMETRLGVSLTETVILRTPLPCSQLGFSLLCDRTLCALRGRALDDFAAAVTNVALPPGFPPLVDLEERAEGQTAATRGGDQGNRHPYSLKWINCPVALGIRDLPAELIAIRVSLPKYSIEGDETVDDLLVFRRVDSEAVARFLEEVTRNDARPRVWSLREGAAQEVEPCTWDQLTLAPTVRKLLQQDFEGFFADREWYSTMKIAHRRG